MNTLFNSKLGSSAMAIFIFILIISGNYLGSLFPCQIQHAFEKNIWLKHFLGYFTLLFFVLLTLPNKSNNDIFKLLSSTTLLYLLFIILSKTTPVIWISVFIMYAFVYLIELKKKNIDDVDKNKETNKYSKKQINVTYDKLTNIQQYIVYFSYVLIIVGFLAYMGEKKFEYKNKFTYSKFLFGVVECKGYTHDRRFLNGLYHSFD